MKLVNTELSKDEVIEKFKEDYDSLLDCAKFILKEFSGKLTRWEAQECIDNQDSDIVEVTKRVSFPLYVKIVKTGEDIGGGVLAMREVTMLLVQELRMREGNGHDNSISIDIYLSLNDHT